MRYLLFVFEVDMFNRTAYLSSDINYEYLLHDNPPS